MEFIKIEKEAIVLDKEEIKKLKNILDYAYHRAVKHPESYIATQDYENFISYMRNKLREKVKGEE
jgi:hypothetical protein